MVKMLVLFAVAVAFTILGKMSWFETIKAKVVGTDVCEHFVMG